MGEQLPFPNESIAAAYGLNPLPDAVRYLGGAGGFSGADLWRFDTEQRRSLCLRRWPAGTRASRVAEVHDVIFRAAEAGVDFLAVPLRCRDGSSVFVVSDRVGEVAPWLEGDADFHRQPSTERLCNAMKALARFHLALAPDPKLALGPCPGIVARQRRVEYLLGGVLQQLDDALACNRAQPQADVSQLILQQSRSVIPQLLARLDEASRWTVRTQPCLRDVRDEHVLFVGDRVSGIVDYDAIRVDNAALDVARLAQSLLGNDEQEWDTAVAAYERVRGLDEHERRFLPLLRDVNPVLSALTWVEWLFLDGRQFDDMRQVERRMTRLAAPIA